MRLLITLLFAFSAAAQADITCPATSIMARPENRDVVLTIGFENGHPARYSFLDESGPLFNVHEAGLPNAAAAAACDPYDDSCLPAVLGTDDPAALNLGRMLGLVNDYQTNPELSDLALPHIDVSRVAAGTGYLIEDASMFGYMGLYEFRDAAGEVLGRYFYAVELMRCQ